MTSAGVTVTPMNGPCAVTAPRVVSGARHVERSCARGGSPRIASGVWRTKAGTAVERGMRLCEFCKVNGARPDMRFCTVQCQRDATKYERRKQKYETSKRRMLTGRNTSITPRHVLEREPHCGHPLQPGVRFWTTRGTPVREPDDPYDAP
jgi:hypothetical protein